MLSCGLCLNMLCVYVRVVRRREVVVGGRLVNDAGIECVWCGWVGALLH